MKRTSLLLCALLLLLFVGCDTVSDVGESNGGSTTENNACLQKSQIGSHNLNPEKVEIMIPNVEWVELQPGEEQS